MQGTGWVALFERIPSNLHDTLALNLTTGAEVVVQQLLKLESEFMVLRGRVAGSNDPGRVVILPYTQLVSVSLIRRVTVNDVEAIFGKAEFAAAGPATSEPAAEAPGGDAALPDAEPEPEEDSGSGVPLRSAAALEAPAAAPSAKAPKNGPISKSILLARLRERLAEKSKS